MEEQERDTFFSPNHKRMLTVATWAKYLAWVALIFYIYRAGLVIFQYQASLVGLQAMVNPPQGMQDFLSILKVNPYYIFDMISSMLSLLLRGTIIYLVLESIALGLNMIVETNVNYRENKNQGGVQ